MQRQIISQGINVLLNELAKKREYGKNIVDMVGDNVLQQHMQLLVRAGVNIQPQQNTIHDLEVCFDEHRSIVICTGYMNAHVYPKSHVNSTFMNLEVKYAVFTFVFINDQNHDIQVSIIDNEDSAKRYVTEMRTHTGTIPVFIAKPHGVTITELRFIADNLMTSKKTLKKPKTPKNTAYGMVAPAAGGRGKRK